MLSCAKNTKCQSLHKSNSNAKQNCCIFSVKKEFNFFSRFMGNNQNSYLDNSLLACLEN